MTFMSESTIAYYQEKRNTFLAFFVNEYRSKITNEFLFVIRGQGITEARLMCRAVYAGYQEQLARCEQRDNHERAEKIRFALGIMRDNRQAALDFAEWAAWHESLDEREKKRLKNRSANSEHYQQEWMATQQPTGRQLALLDSFGYQGTVDNRLHASQLIDEYITLRQDYRGRK